MKYIPLSSVPRTTAHDTLLRQQYVRPGELKSDIQTMNYVELHPSESFPSHHHPDCEECFFVIEGTVEARVNEKVCILQAGDLLVVEPGEEHQLVNTGAQRCRFFQVRVLVRAVAQE